MQKNKRIGLNYEATLDVLLRHLMTDLESTMLGNSISVTACLLRSNIHNCTQVAALRTFRLDGLHRKLCFYGLAGDQKWFQQVLQLSAPQRTSLPQFGSAQSFGLSPRHWKGNGEAMGNRTATEIREPCVISCSFVHTYICKHIAMPIYKLMYRYHTHAYIICGIPQISTSRPVEYMLHE